MSDAYAKVIAARDYLRQRFTTQWRVGLVLGSGLGDLGGQGDTAQSIPFRQIPHWPRGQVEGHRGELIASIFADEPVVVLSGRAHLYEGFSATDVAFGVRVLGLLGVNILILTNAAGAIGTAWEPGALALISDHVNMQGTSPLIGDKIDSRFGSTFVDLSEPYDPAFRSAASQTANKLGIHLAEGVYAGVLGPNYETPAEVRHLRAIGADMVGMSTVQETIAARQLGMRVLAISILTNKAAGLSEQKLSHEDVLAAGSRASGDLLRLLLELAPQLPAL